MAFALVANTSKASSGTTGSIDTTGATFIVITATCTTNTSATPTDSKSNRWVFMGLSQGQATAIISVWIAAGSSLSVGSGHTFTVGATGSPSFRVAAFSGAALTFQIDAGYPVASAGTGTTAQSGSVTPPEDNCLVLAFMSYRTTTTISINGGFTITDQNPFSAGVAVGGALAYLIQTTAAASNPQWSWTNNAVNACMQLVVRSTPAAPSSGRHGFAMAA